MPKKKQPGISYDATKPEVKPDGYGLSNKGEGLSPQIRHTRPDVARHCARMIIAHNMDTQAAVSKMLSVQYPEATDAQVVQLARTIQASPHVQREMTKLLEEIGWGDEALKKLIGLLWQEVLGMNDKRWAAAARLLAEITGAGKAAEKGKKLPTLRLAGMDEGLSKMLGDAAPSNDVEEITDDTPLDILESDDVEDDASEED